ncbi:TetR/AcrR family transcriptional regulator [Shouchella plakortidis]|uniref:TetR/AcrR family transcriptional regulator n=1 Tax=Alkalicoccobacillus plakortidis TaxID=444060 RepID=A0ABT0XNF3_9BACI|nr:TetR/AcrR family transcriptional regulator [Alkalicoccobacillus plakortidis]
MNKGYEETSLDDIVEEIGIKKQSIYSHFKNKEDIFLQVMNDAVNKEISFVNHFFESRSQVELQEVLFKLLVRYKERYLLEDDKNIKFLLRMAFMPPYHLRDTAMEQFEKYNQELERNVKEAFSKAEHIRVTAEEGTISFLNFLDGILVELIYTNSSKFETRLRVSWEVYWQGISMVK